MSEIPMSELLMQQTRELEQLRERLRLLQLANECDNIDEFRKQLFELLTTSGE